MNWDKDIKNSLDAHLSGLHVSERQQAQMFNRIVQGEKPIMKRKISAALVFAIVLVLAMGTVALAAGLGLFGHFSNPEEGNNAPRLEKLESVADTYEMTKTAAMPTPAVPVTGETMYDKLLAEQYSHTFELTLDQAYCDGHKLYYSYTLKRNAPMAVTYGEGEPTGDFNYTWVEEGKTANDCMTLEGEEKAWFEDHKVAYELFNGFGLGDGCEHAGRARSDDSGQRGRAGGRMHQARLPGGRNSGGCDRGRHARLRAVHQRIRRRVLSD